MPHTSLICPVSRRAPIFYPLILTLHLLYSCRLAWKLLNAICRPRYSSVWFRRKGVIWYTRRHVSSEFHDALAWVLRGGFLASFWRSTNLASPSHIGPPFRATMVNMALPLRYLILRLSTHLLSYVRIIWWSIDTLGYLMMML